MAKQKEPKALTAAELEGLERAKGLDPGWHWYWKGPTDDPVVVQVRQRPKVGLQVLGNVYGEAWKEPVARLLENPEARFERVLPPRYPDVTAGLWTDGRWARIDVARFHGGRLQDGHCEIFDRDDGRQTLAEATARQDRAARAVEVVGIVATSKFGGVAIVAVRIAGEWKTDEESIRKACKEAWEKKADGQ